MKPQAIAAIVMVSCALLSLSGCGGEDGHKGGGTPAPVDLGGGDPVPGDPVPGDPVPGDPDPVDPVPGEPTQDGYKIDLVDTAFFAWQNGGDATPWQAVPVGGTQALAIGSTAEFSLAYTCVDGDGGVKVFIEHFDAGGLSKLEERSDLSHPCFKSSASTIDIEFDVENLKSPANDVMVGLGVKGNEFTEKFSFSGEGSHTVQTLPTTGAIVYAAEFNNHLQAKRIVRAGSDVTLEDGTKRLIDFADSVSVDKSIKVDVANSNLRGEEWLEVQSFVAFSKSDLDQQTDAILLGRGLPANSSTVEVPMMSQANFAELSPNPVVDINAIATYAKILDGGKVRQTVESRAAGVWSENPAATTLSLPYAAAEKLSASVQSALADNGVQLGVDWLCSLNSAPVSQAIFFYVNAPAKLEWVVGRGAARTAADTQRHYVVPDFSGMAGWNSSWNIKNDQTITVGSACSTNSYGLSTLEALPDLKFDVPRKDIPQEQWQAYSIREIGLAVGKDIL